jgi:peroxiredoxin
MKACISLTLFLISITAGWTAPEVGKEAPEFELKGHDGKSYSLSQFKGSYVVLEWFNYGCPYVKKHYSPEYSNMQNLQGKWTAPREGKPKVAWLSIVSSAPGKQGHVSAHEASELKISLDAKMDAILLDPKGTVGGLYDAVTTPHMFVIDQKGVLRYQGAIYSC